MTRKFTFIVLLLQVMLVPVFGQTVLTYSTHAMNEGDVLTLKKIKGNILPGAPGENQIWDYSDGEIAGDHIIYYNTDRTSSSANKSFVCNQDDEMTVFFDLSTTQKLYNGLTTENVKIVFEQPIKEMVYPFQYNSQIIGKMKGSYTNLKDGTTESIDGEYSVTADGWGTLILPNGVTLKNVLRVKYVKDYYQMFSGSLFHITVNRYLFYSSYSRYAVMQIHENITDCDCGCNSVIYSACFNDNVIPANYNINTNEESNNVSPASVARISYKIYPNPFENELKLDYTIQTDAKVKITILDLTGKEIKTLVNKIQQEGYYSVIAELGQIPSGSYILNIQVGNDSYTEKVIKK